MKRFCFVYRFVYLKGSLDVVSVANRRVLPNKRLMAPHRLILELLFSKVSGGPIYVSDKPGHHDFNLLKRLVLDDGSLLRCTQAGLPTLDTLFEDVMRDKESLLKAGVLSLDIDPSPKTSSGHRLLGMQR